MKLHKLSNSDKIQYLQLRAEECIIPLDDRYLNIYPNLIQSISELKLDENNLALIGSAVFGWMPTQLSLQHSALNKALQIMLDLKNNPSKNLDTAQILELANVFQAFGGKSVVAASKLLHFVFPDRFPIWDRIVAKEFGLASNGEEAPSNYLHFATFCKEMSKQPNVQFGLQVFKGRLIVSGYNYYTTDMRLIELLFFLD
jgi:hypothetical protein